ncbi:MAG: glycosyltransferase family 4 protein [Candidatus Latescibacterota bacterium]
MIHYKRKPIHQPSQFTTHYSSFITHTLFSMVRSLLLTNDYPPVPGGISTVYYHMWKYFPADRMLILTPRVSGAADFDRRSGRRVSRFPFFGRSRAGRLSGFVMMMFLTAYYVLFRRVREIHAGQILSCGPIGYFFQRVFGVPCYLWLYGGETTPAYRRSRREEKLVSFLLRRCRYLVTNSPATTREFVEYGIPGDRLIEILPGVDAGVFTPGSKPESLIQAYGLAGKRILLTVARLAKRKGHDLVLQALPLLADADDLHYLIVGEGEDRPRLEALTAREGLEEKVTFVGWVEDRDLPDYYRLADIYVMPNREVLEVTDSLEGFGISFIEAAACGIPAIAGRSGGAGAAVLDHETGFIVDPENPRELADRIQLLLDSPGLRSEMGRKGRERAERELGWERRTRELAARLTVSPLPLTEATHGRG